MFAWRKPKYFIVIAVFLRIVAIALTVPIVVDDAIKMLCDTSVNYISYTAGTLPFISFSIFPLLFTFLFLIIIVRLIKRQTITENIAAKKALLKFGFFLVIVQGINAITQVIIPAIILVLTSNSVYTLALTITIAFYDLSLIPTPILICIFFKTVQLKLRKWLCSCCNYCSASGKCNKYTCYSTI